MVVPLWRPVELAAAAAAAPSNGNVLFNLFRWEPTLQTEASVSKGGLFTWGDYGNTL